MTNVGPARAARPPATPPRPPDVDVQANTSGKFAPPAAKRPTQRGWTRLFIAAGGEASGGWSRATRRTIVAATVLLATVNSLGLIAQAASLPAVGRTELLSTALLLAALWALMGGFLHRGCARFALPAAVVGSSVGLALALDGGARPADQWWATPFLVCFAAAVPLIGGLRPVPLLLGFGFPIGWTIAWYAQQAMRGDLTRIGAQNTVIGFVTLALFAIIGVRMLETLGQRSDELARARIATETKRVAAQADALRLRRLWRFVHDEVLYTLRLIAVADRTRLPSDDVRDTARRTSEALRLDGRRWRPTSAHESLGHLADRVTRQFPDVEVDLDVDDGISLPRVVLESLSTAALEALRNAERHAHADVVRCRVAAAGTSVRITVEDTGVGFQTAQAGGGHHGIAESMRAAMAEIGGGCEVVSAPGEGTTVTLSWSASRVLLAGRAWSWPASERRRIVNGLGHMQLPLVACAPLIALSSWPLFPQPAVALASAGGLLVVFALLWLGAVGPGVGRWSFAAAVLASSACTAFYARGVGSELPASITGTVYGAAMATLMFGFLARTKRELVIGVAMLPVTYVVASVAFSPDGVLHVGEALLAAAWAVMGAGLAFVVRIWLDRLGQRAALEHATALHDQATLLDEWSSDSQAASELRYIERIVGTLLAGVASGRKSLHDPAVRLEAERLEHLVREGMSLAEANELREAMIRAQAEGCPVTIRIGMRMERGLERALASLVTALADEAESNPLRLRGGAVLTAMERGGRRQVSLYVRDPDCATALAARLPEGERLHLDDAVVFSWARSSSDPAGPLGAGPRVPGLTGVARTIPVRVP